VRLSYSRAAAVEGPPRASLLCRARPLTSSSPSLIKTKNKGGVSVTLVGHPFDTLKVRLQTQPTTNPIYGELIAPSCHVPSPARRCRRRRLPRSAKAGLPRLERPLGSKTTPFPPAKRPEAKPAQTTRDPPKHPPDDLLTDLHKTNQKQKRKTKTAGVVDCARKTVQWEGLGGLYKGVASPLAGQMVFRASLFSTFGAAKRWLGTDGDGNARPLSAADFYKAGAITGFVAAFSEGPIDFYKSQIQVQIVRAKTDPAYKPPYTTVGACVRATLRENGVRGPFQGLGATILRNTPANAVYLGSFEVMKRAACERLGAASPADLPAWAVLGSAGLGGVAYWAVIFPVDCVKSAMQTDTIVRADRKYTNMLQTATDLWREGGVRRFYKGFAPCIIRAAPANASMLFTVEAVHNLMASSSSSPPK